MLLLHDFVKACTIFNWGEYVDDDDVKSIWDFGKNPDGLCQSYLRSCACLSQGVLEQFA